NSLCWQRYLSFCKQVSLNQFTTWSVIWIPGPRVRTEALGVESNSLSFFHFTSKRPSLFLCTKQKKKTKGFIFLTVHITTSIKSDCRVGPPPNLKFRQRPQTPTGPPLAAASNLLLPLPF
ncbi:hypothetical protein V8G54_029823, partial [Vigna mungo]